LWCVRFASKAARCEAQVHGLHTRIDGIWTAYGAFVESVRNNACGSRHGRHTASPVAQGVIHAIIATS